jgi:hypothetical protein
MSRRPCRILIAAFLIQLIASAAFAQSLDLSSASAPASSSPSPHDQTAAPQVAIEYSEGYRMRAKIHRISSFATLPLFVAEGIIGQSFYSESTQGKKDAHLAVAAGIGALFTVNTVTGVWNLVEARKDPNHKKRRLVHGLLMLGADAGFLATAAMGPESEHGNIAEGKGAHRAMAFTSIGLATTGYLVMLFGNH